MKNHSLTLPKWGPYNKVYTGISHVFDETEGVRFDVDLFPGFYRRSVMIPKSVADCGAHAWKVSEDGTRFAYRYELERKDLVYLDTEFCVSDETCIATLSFVNNTEIPQSVQADLCFSLRYPTFNKKEIKECEINKPESVLWVNAEDYQEIQTDVETMCDGLKKGEAMGSGFTGKWGIGGDMFGAEGTMLRYPISKNTKELGIRYQTNEDVKITVSRGDISCELTLKACEEFSFLVVPFVSEKGETITFCPHGGNLTFDGFSYSAEQNLDQVSFQLKERERVPVIRKREGGMDLCYKDKTYHMSWNTDHAVIREFYCDDAGRMLLSSIHNHVTELFSDGTEGHFTDLFLRPVFLQPKETKQIQITISTQQKPEPIKERDYFSFACNQEGDQYLFSQNLEAAVAMLNVVYPVYCKGQWIKHYTPGREWDCLYTWDSGLIGTGLSALSLKRAEECLNAYLVEWDDPDSSFVMHGSPVATQIFLFLELWQKTQDEGLLEKYYTSLKKYYLFYSDKKKKAPKTGLLQTWNQFYNSGGWDDYPPQRAVHDQRLEESVTPVISTAMTVLFAKILCLFAPEQDLPLYQKDIAFFTKAMEQAWDEESGYYGYVCHDATGEKTGILRTKSGENYNKGMDGLYPYLAGTAPKEREEGFLTHIKEGLFTKIGVSVVDTRASYYQTDGYWNGSVWMPHQWILSKALLDHGQHDLSYEIAMCALEVWKRETEETYNCYEHFMVANGRGAGFHQFSGLSAPVMKWFETYFVPGSITCGFQTKIVKAVWSKDQTRLQLTLDIRTPQTQLVVCMKERKEDYQLQGGGSMHKLNQGAYCISLPNTVQTIEIF